MEKFKRIYPISMNNKKLRGVVYMNKYNIYWKDICVGILYEEFDIVRKLRIELNEKAFELYRPIPLIVRSVNGVVDNENTWWWINDRITPRTQEGIEEKLANMGMSEYEPWAIFQYNNGMLFDDFVWVGFDLTKTFYNWHPRAQYVD